MTLEAMLAMVDARKTALGLTETAADTEAMRNKGANRTPEKRELLRCVEARAEAAGFQPIRSYY
jgi:hypothetical protein